MTKFKLENFNVKKIRDILQHTDSIKSESDIENIEIEQLYYNRLIDVNCTNIKKILNNKNTFIKFYLLQHNKLESLKVDCKDAEELRDFNRDLIAICNDFKIDLTDKIFDIVLKRFTGLNVQGIIGILANLNLSNDHIMQLKKAFGYNVIYRGYKDMIDEIFMKRYTHKELGLAMFLLNNEKLCFSQTLDIFNRLNEYISKGVTDKNLIACCTVLMSLLEHTPNMLSDKKEFLNGITTYLMNILFERSNYTVYNQNDTYIITETIKVLCKSKSFKETSHKLKIGIIRKCLFHIRMFLEYSNSVYEELMTFIALCKCLGYFLDICNVNEDNDKQSVQNVDFVVLGNEKQPVIKQNKSSFKELEDSVGFTGTVISLLKTDIIKKLEKYKVPESICLEYKDNELAQDRLISAKYFLLDRIAKIKKIVIDRVDFYNDVYKLKRPKYIFRSIDRLKEQVSWSDIIILASHAVYKSDYIPLLMDPYYTKNSEHLSYIFLFVFSLKNDFDSLNILTASLTNSTTFDQIDKYWEILIYIYIFYIKSDDKRIVKVRNCIIHKILNSRDLNLSSILQMTIDEIRKGNVRLCKNLFPLFYFIIFNLKEIDIDLFIECYTYIILESEKLPEFTIKKEIYGQNSPISLNLSKLNINQSNFVLLQAQPYKIDGEILKIFSSHCLNFSLLLKLLKVKNPNVDELSKLGFFDRYFHCLALTAFFRIINEPKDFIYINIFDYVLTCHKKQRKELIGLLRKPKNSKFYKCYKMLKKLQKC